MDVTRPHCQIEPQQPGLWVRFDAGSPSACREATGVRKASRWGGKAHSMFKYKSVDKVLCIDLLTLGRWDVHASISLGCLE